MKLNEIIAKVVELGSSLIGSRYMNCCNLLSDWDYLLLDADGSLSEILVNMGFTQVIGSPDESDDYYYDTGIVTWYRIYADDGQKVEVQITNNQTIFDMIYATFYELKFDATYKSLVKPFRKLAYLLRLNEKVQKSDIDSKLKTISHSTTVNCQYVVFEQLQKLWKDTTIFTDATKIIF